MYSGLAVADYFVKRCLERGTPITNMTVLKMIYFAHGLCYALMNEKLIDDPFYAWPWGPVERNTYDAFKKYVARPITEVPGKKNKELEEIENNPDMRLFLDSLLPLANVDAFALSRKSHEPGGPWDVTEKYHKIDDKIIQVFFTARYGRTGRKE